MDGWGALESGGRAGGGEGVPGPLSSYSSVVSLSLLVHPHIKDDRSSGRALGQPFPSWVEISKWELGCPANLDETSKSPLGEGSGHGDLESREASWPAEGCVICEEGAL